MRIEFNETNWNNWLLAKALSQRTRLEYNKYLRKLAEPTRGIKISQDEVMAQVAKQPYNSVLRAFLNNLIFYIKTNQHYPKVVRDEVAMIYLPKQTGRKKRKIVEFLSEAEVLAIANHVKETRIKLMILLTFYCGLRESELVGQYAITPMSFSWHKWLAAPDQMGTIKIQGKGNKTARVICPAHLMKRIYQYIRSELVSKQGRDDKLFNIGPRRWAQLLSKASKAAIMQHTNPHKLRHSYGTWLKANGYHVDEIKEMMRHDSITSTMIYEHIDIDLLKNKYPQTIMTARSDSESSNNLTSEDSQ